MNNLREEPVVIQIPRKAIEDCYTLGVINILESFIPLSEYNRNRVIFEVLGYHDDHRDIYDIPVIRKFFINLFSNYKGLFYWVDLNSHMFLLLALLLFKPIRTDHGVTVSSTDLQQFLIAGFKNLNEFCEKNGLSSVPTTQAIREWLQNIKIHNLVVETRKKYVYYNKLACS